MHAAFDAVMLSVYLHPTAKPPKPIPDLQARIQLLVDELEAAGAKIIIPTPILSEFLVLVGPVDGPVYLSELTNTDVFDIQPFDTRAAIEAAELQRKAMAAGDKRAGSKDRWQVVKVDRQFVAIAKVNGVDRIYSDDVGVQTLAKVSGITCKGISDLPAPPPPDPQMSFLAEVASASTEPAQPSAQSPAAEKPEAPAPAPPRRAIHLGDQGLPQQDSSRKKKPKEDWQL